MTTKLLKSLVIALLLSNGVSLEAKSASGEPAVGVDKSTLRVSLVDEEGHSVVQAHLYIYKLGRDHSVATAEAEGFATLQLTPGVYKIYAGSTCNLGDAIDHYSSPEATLRITPYEDRSLILTLHRVNNPEFGITEPVATKMGLDAETLKQLN